MALSAVEILVVAPYPPYPPASAGQPASSTLIRTLSRAHRVTLLCFASAALSPQGDLHYQRFKKERRTDV